MNSDTADNKAIETLYRSCPTCEASCGLTLKIDRQKRQILSVKGDPEDHRSRGYVCAKSQAFRYVYEDCERVTQPLKKVIADNGEPSWQAVDWETALSEVGKRLADIRSRHGKDAIAMYYGNPNGHNFHTMIYTELFISLLDTERFFSAGSVDQQPKNLSSDLLYGNPWLFSVPDLSRSDFFVCMGANPVVSQGSLLGGPDAKGRIEALMQRGGHAVVIDPRKTETADCCSEHIFIRPGTDAFLLFAWINELFASDNIHLGHLAAFTDGIDKLREMSLPYTAEAVASTTGVPATRLRKLIGDFNSASAPVLYGRIGLCTQEFGTLASWLVDVVNILSGRMDVPGGAMFNKAATGQNEATGEVGELKHGRWKSRVRGLPEYMSMLAASCMAEELAYDGDDKVRALITVAGNPVLSVPNGKQIGSAAESLEFMVALDIYVNETTVKADYILPSTVHVEHSNYDFLFSSFSQENFARYSPVVFPAAAKSKHQYEIFLELLGRINGMSAEDLNAMMLDGMIAHIKATPGLGHLDAEDIKRKTANFENGERLLDILLRVGPYGNQFDDDRDGLNLQKVKDAKHGIDLGQLEPRLPGILRTEGQRLRLVHDLLLQDMPRLEAALERPPDEFLLIGRRNIRDMNSWLHNIKQYARGKNRCTLLIHPKDAQSLGITDGGQALLQSQKGKEQVEVSFDANIMPGVVSLPHGFGHHDPATKLSIASSDCAGVCANDIVDEGPLDVPSGTSVVNGVPVTITAAN
ncbi:MAG: molybdopterin-dependent oxidoreductase [Halieaceae bacterium]|jgi:anaerobic selenocysteine-containing dehydrogenase|nr:molybdopterin-dependent oxidoreductase [Halieaceae bacterium]